MPMYGVIREKKQRFEVIRGCYIFISGLVLAFTCCTRFQSSLRGGTTVFETTGRKRYIGTRRKFVVKSGLNRLVENCKYQSVRAY